MTSCRGVLIAGVTNRARTQIAEGFLRCLTDQRIFVASGGVFHHGLIHPLAVKSMSEVGIDLSKQAVSSLEARRRQGKTYDVYISIDGPYKNRCADRYQRRHAVKQSEDDNGGELYGDPLLTPSMPSHWTIAMDAADARQRWNIWSPRDPTIYHENSTRKFQDNLYEGEPLFMRLELSSMRKEARVSERWEVDEVADSFAMEREEQQLKRFRRVRDELALRCVQLLRRLEEHYSETMLIDATCLNGLETAEGGVVSPA